MKNIHVLPTDKPSRLFLNRLNNKILLEDIVNPSLKNVLPSGSYQNIYITFDEDIKEGDWFLTDDKRIEKCASDWKAREWHKKIILTTDQDLIKDGVQAIDDEFLEFFAKNPSCEEIKVESINIGNGKLGYIICKPKEELKKGIDINKFEQKTNKI